jgi:hypothetical protein
LRRIALHVACVLVALASLTVVDGAPGAQAAPLPPDTMVFPDEGVATPPPAPATPTVAPPAAPAPAIAAPAVPPTPAVAPPPAVVPAVAPKKVIVVPDAATAAPAAKPPVAPAPPPAQAVVPKAAEAKPPEVKPAEPAPKASDSAKATSDEGGTADAARREADKKFVKGELANVGGLGLVPWENRFGVILGLERLGEIFFIGIKPGINWSRDLLDNPFSMSFAIPFRLQLLDTRADRRWSKAGRPRAADWDQVGDWAQIIQFVKWGGKEKHFFVNVNQFEASTLGHGTIVKRYNQNLNINTRRVSLELDGFLDYVGGEFYMNDVVGPNVLGVLAFVKPLSFIDRSNYMLRSFSLGFTFAADVDAPMRNKLDFDDVDNDGRRGLWDAAYNRWAGEILVDQSNFEPQYVSTAVLAYGIDLEEKWIDTGAVDWKSYIDYSWLQTGVPIDDRATQVYDDVPTRSVLSGGFTLGQLVRVNLGQDPLHALRFRFEYRTYDYNYLPSYFDVLYETQRVQYYRKADNARPDLSNMTKLQQVLGRDPHGPRVHGMYFEGSWRMSHWLALAFGVELNNQTADDSLFVHLEVPVLDWWQFMATYHRRTANGFTDLFHWFSGQNDLFLAKTRFAIGDVFAVTIEALTPFSLGNNGLFETTPQVNLNVELGFGY